MTPNTSERDGAAGQRSLDIYFMPGCPGGDQAMHVGATVTAWAIANLELRLHDLTEPGATRPPQVFAVPAYLLDGRIISLGTPELPWLYELLTSRNVS